MPNHKIVTGKSGLDHVGFTVSNLKQSIRFYRMLLQVEPLMKRLYREQYIGKLVGYKEIELDAAFFNLDESGLILELIEYRSPPGARVDMETYNAGNAHLCLIVDDLDEVYKRLQAQGVEFRSSEPVVIPIGPYEGGRACYLRDPDGITIELMQLPPSGGPNFSSEPI